MFTLDDSITDNMVSAMEMAARSTVQLRGLMALPGTSTVNALELLLVSLIC